MSSGKIFPIGSSAAVSAMFQEVLDPDETCIADAFMSTTVERQLAVIELIIDDITDHQVLSMLTFCGASSQRRAETVTCRLAPILLEKKYHQSLCYIASNLTVDCLERLIPLSEGVARKLLTNQLISLAKLFAGNQIKLALNQEVCDVLLQEARQRYDIDVYARYVKDASTAELCAAISHDPLEKIAMDELTIRCDVDPNLLDLIGVNVDAVFVVARRTKNHRLFTLCCRNIDTARLAKECGEDDDVMLKIVIGELCRRSVN